MINLLWGTVWQCAKWGDVMSDIVSAKDQQLALITSPARRLSGASVPAGLQSGAERCCGPSLEKQP